MERTSFGAKVLNLIKSNKTSEYMISINNRRDEIIKLNCSLLNFPFFLKKNQFFGFKLSTIIKKNSKKRKYNLA